MAGTERVEHGRPATHGWAAGSLEAVRQQNLLSYLAALSGLLMLADLYLIFMVAPTASSEHLWHLQRVFYFHIPIAIMSFLAFFLVFVASIAYLVRRNERWDAVAHACAEVGVVFVTLALLTGIIWGRPVWDTWWQWEPRLTTTLILWLIYVAYLMIRAYAPNRTKGALYSAVVGIIGFVDVPIVYYSVKLWKGLHPSPVVGPLASADALNSTMYGVLLFSFITFLVLFVYLMLERASLRDAEDQIGRLRSSLRRSGRL